MQAGKLRHLLSLQRRAVAKDPDTGAVSETWPEVAKVWASIEPLSAREFVAAQGVQSEVTTRITIRYRSDVNATMRLEYAARGVIYNIQGVLPDKGSGLEYLTLPCSEGANQGAT